MKEILKLNAAVHQALRRRGDYMIVTYNARDALIFMKLMPNGCLYPRSFVLDFDHRVSDESRWTNRDAAKRALAHMRQELKRLSELKKLSLLGLNLRSLDMLTIIKISSTSSVVGKRVQATSNKDDKYTAQLECGCEQVPCICYTR